MKKAKNNKGKQLLTHFYCSKIKIYFIVIDIKDLMLKVKLKLDDDGDDEFEEGS